MRHLALWHPYFADGRLCELAVVPTPASAEHLRRVCWQYQVRGPLSLLSAVLTIVGDTTGLNVESIADPW